MSYEIRPLDVSTWGAFAELVERNNGVFGGCWCIGYHPDGGEKGHQLGTVPTVSAAMSLIALR